MKKENGFSVIELLLSITILLIISSIFYSVLIGAYKNYNVITEKTELEQEANNIIATIKSYHLSEDTQYFLSYNADDRTAKIGKNVANNVLGNNIVTFEVRNSDGLINLDNPISTNRYIQVHIVLQTKSGDTVDNSTIIKKY